MWVLPSTFSRSAPVEAGWTMALEWQLSRLAQSAGLSGKRSPLTSWRRAWKRDRYIQHLSGLTSEPSTASLGVASWIASLRATRANRSPSQDVGLACEIAGTFGLMFVMSLQTLNQPLSSLKTYQDTCRSATRKSKPSFKEWTTKLRQVCLQRRKLVLHNRGSDYSFWPTIKATDTTGGRGVAGVAKARAKGGGARNLNESVKNDWPNSHSFRPDQRATGRRYRRSSGRRMSVVFVGWLMGWNTIVPGSSNYSAMASSQHKQRMRSCLYGVL